MWKWTANYSLFHSPNQAQVEFLSDLALHAQDWVSENTRDIARLEANHRINSRFLSPVGDIVGEVERSERLLEQENDRH